LRVAVVVKIVAILSARSSLISPLCVRTSSSTVTEGFSDLIVNSYLPLLLPTSINSALATSFSSIAV